MSLVSARSEGHEPDALEVKASGTFATDQDLRRGQRVEVTLTGTVTGHDFRDTYDRKSGDLDRTIKRAIVAGETMVRLVPLPPRTKPPAVEGQTSIREDGRLVDATTGEVIADPFEEVRAQGVEVSLADGPTRILADGLGRIDPAEVAAHAGEVERIAAGEFDPAEEPARDPTVPEDAWRTLNLEQKQEVAAIVDRIYRLSESFQTAGNPTDREAARARVKALADSLREEFGIELDPDAAERRPDEADEPAPAPVLAGGPELSALELTRRKRFLERQGGLPAEAAAARREELAEIDRRLAALA